MKKRNLFLVIVLIAFAFVMVACGKEKEEPTYNVSFETNGGTSAALVTVKKASDVSLPEVTKEGYELKGWFLDAEFANEFKADIELTADVTLYAKWEQLKFKVRFLVNGNVIDEQEVEYGAQVTAPTNPEIEGYNFENWDKEFASVKSNLDINAVFKAKEYMIKFMDGSNEIGTVTVEYGKDAVAPTNTDKAGYTFKGWDKEITNVTGHMVVNALYEANQYNVAYYDGDVALNLAPAKVTYGEAVAIPDFSKAGTIFDGWYDSAEFTNKVSDLSKLTADAKLYAKYYTVKYFDGTTEITTLGNAKIEDGILQVPAYEVEGFTFVGWYTDDNYNLPLDIEEEVKADLNLKALLVKIDYNGGKNSWDNSDWGTNEVKNGIDPISTLPEEFEKDFYKYLSDENLLESDLLGATMKAPTWEKFSGLNPEHNGDPKRIWNDCTTNSAKDASDGYAALFLYGDLEIDEATRKLTAINGGFLGTEPYRTKYFNLMQHLVLLYDGKYLPKNYSVPQFGDSNAARELYAFLLDGYFYGTQGLQNDGSVFDAARKVIPTTTTGYTWDGSKLVAYTNKYETTTDIYSMDTVFAVPFGATQFQGWYLDAAGNTKLTDSNITNRMTIYAKWA